MLQLYCSCNYLMLLLLFFSVTNDVLNKISVQFAGKPELDAKATR